jgi:hypothetical protein
MVIRTLTCLLLALIASGCGASRGPGASAVQQRSAIDLYFPLIDGTIYTYQHEAGDAFMIRVKRTGPGTAQLVTGGSIKTLSVSPTAVRRDPMGTLLQAPFEPGATWQGDHGSVRIVDNHAQVKVPAGSFKDCVHTLEEVGGDARGRIETWFCPDVGIAKKIVQEWQGAQSLTQVTELRSFGPPVDLQK